MIGRVMLPKSKLILIKKFFAGSKKKLHDFIMCDRGFTDRSVQYLIEI